MPLYEFDKYEARYNHLQTAPAEVYVPFRNARRRSFLLWGEHCTECAAPDCYSSCALYQARPDRRCRRFEFGIFANAAFPTGYGPAAEVLFKRWGILSARGNAKMLPASIARAMELASSALSPVTNFIGRCLGALLRDVRFSYLTFALLERFNHWLLQTKTSLPDAFVFECYNPNSSSVVVQFSMMIERAALPKSVRVDQLPPPFTLRIEIPPGYFRQDIPATSFQQIINTKLPFGLSITPDGGEGTHLVFLSLDFVTYEDLSLQPAVNLAPLSQSAVAATLVPMKSSSAAAKASAAKCVVFDLDHTLWSGVLLEGDVSLKAGVREVLEILDSRGILLSIASKNSREHAHEQLVSLGIEEYFLYPQINWGRKSDSLRSIATDIDIGIDTFIFVDDNPFDRDEVGRELPQVEVLDETTIIRLPDHPRLQGSTSAEAKVRRQMYRRAMVRSDAAKEFGDDYLAFLRTCEICIDIHVLSPSHLSRVSELAQRTNQLNFSGTKYKTDDLASLVSDPTLDKYVVECSDKYGSYGIVGLCVARRLPGVVRILEFMLSCRVQGRFVEQSLFHYLVSLDRSISRLEVNFKKTDRNSPAQAVLRKLGFDIDQDGILVRNVGPEEFAVDFMQINAPKELIENSL